ncbi:MULTISPECIES: tripartite tricarboxylate transporter substrate binding protein [unclassified Achromobacter]|uniref:Bug family tripartite tricarboxylate transporter substrate binding protein n=1 Tax=unclassified Achromobacter TaxID=2626865 RepID=UPI000B519634|nr:LacI family transcriptional regulator [Achromobacter sp. HZ28]OWT78667.1 LacI family transcriptional regulator [Achromobacter sp. HZ34]
MSLPFRLPAGAARRRAASFARHCPSPGVYLSAFFCALACAPLPAPSSAASYPDKPIRVIVPFPPAGGTDLIAREVVREVAQAKGWNFVVENHPGAGGNLGIDAVARSAPDGYTIGLGQTSNLSINPTLYRKMPYDSVKDLAPIGLMAGAPLVLVVAADSPYRTLADLINAARKDTLAFASPGNGTVAHLSGEMLQKMAGVKFMHIPYKGASQAVVDLIGGRVQLYMSSVPTLLGHIKDGKFRALAVTSAKRVADLPDVPTMAQAGYPGYEAVTWFGYVAPAGTPQDIIDALSTEMNKALKQPRLIKVLQEQGADVIGGTPAQFADVIKADIQRWKPVIQDAGVHID